MATQVFQIPGVDSNIIGSVPHEILWREEDGDDGNNEGNDNNIENMIDNNDNTVLISHPVMDRDHSIVQSTPAECPMAD